MQPGGTIGGDGPHVRSESQRSSRSRARRCARPEDGRWHPRAQAREATIPGPPRGAHAQRELSRDRSRRTRRSDAALLSRSAAQRATCTAGRTTAPKGCHLRQPLLDGRRSTIEIGGAPVTVDEPVAVPLRGSRARRAAARRQRRAGAHRRPRLAAADRADRQPHRIRSGVVVRATSFSASADRPARVRLRLPQGWTATPAEPPFALAARGEYGVGRLHRDRARAAPPGRQVIDVEASQRQRHIRHARTAGDRLSAHPDPSPLLAGGGRGAGARSEGRASARRLHHGQRRSGARRAAADGRRRHAARRRDARDRRSVALRHHRRRRPRLGGAACLRRAISRACVSSWSAVAR